jgi:hypothetical protein
MTAARDHMDDQAQRTPVEDQQPARQPLAMPPLAY